MSKRNIRLCVVGLCMAALLVCTVPIAVSQMEQAHPVYTFVSQFQIPRAQWAAYGEDTEKNAIPIFNRLLADGTINGWGTFEQIVHTPDGMTHGAWWSSTSLAGITKVLDEVRKAGPRPGQIAATKHEDYLMRSVFSHTTPVSGEGTGYLRVNCTLTEPGKGDDFAAILKKELGPTFDDQLKKGVLTSYKMEQQYVLNGPGSMRCTVVTFANAENMNKWADVIDATFDKLSPEDRKIYQDAVASSVVPNSRRDILARITHSAQK